MLDIHCTHTISVASIVFEPSDVGYMPRLVHKAQGLCFSQFGALLRESSDLAGTDDCLLDYRIRRTSLAMGIAYNVIVAPCAYCGSRARSFVAHIHL
jgi:hypothetical protein